LNPVFKEAALVMNLTRLVSLALAVVSIPWSAGLALAQGTPARGEELKFVAIVTRHGVRPPTVSNDQINPYSAQPWPKWDVPPGYLTAHGRALMKLFGAYDRAQFARAGLFAPSGCADVPRVYFWADTDERTIETGRALAEGMLPGCTVEVHSAPAGTRDPLFNPIAAGVGHADPELAVAAVAGRIGGHPEALLTAYRPALETMRQVLTAGKTVKQPLLDLPVSLGPAAGGLVEMRGPLATAATLAEDFLLEYTNGMEGHDLGWGRLTESNLRQMMTLNTAFTDLTRRTPQIARTSASNLLSHVLKAMEQAATGKAVPGAIGRPGDRMLVIVGHDSTLSNIQGTLNLSWLLPGYQPNDTPPGGALVFELWRQPAGGAYSVRTYYTAQTLEQMRQSLPLTLASPPAKATVFVPGCSTAKAGSPCDWKAFQRTIEAAVDPAFVKE
jgi:4-phytase/acid phosphatase